MILKVLIAFLSLPTVYQKIAPSSPPHMSPQLTIELLSSMSSSSGFNYSFQTASISFNLWSLWWQAAGGRPGKNEIGDCSGECGPSLSQKSFWECGSSLFTLVFFEQILDMCQRNPVETWLFSHSREFWSNTFSLSRSWAVGAATHTTVSSKRWEKLEKKTERRWDGGGRDGHNK